ncbi:MAG: S8 family serine peptidase [Bacteroidota bacterium]
MKSLFHSCHILLLILLFSTVSTAQHFENISLGLRLALEELNENDQNDKHMHILVKGDLEQIQRLTRDLDGTYKFGVLDIASVSLRADRILELAEMEGIERLEYNNYPGTVLADFLRENNNLDSVHMGLGNLPMGLEGEGVVVGIIDSGIEWQHEDFQHDDGTSRILYIWDQVTNNTNMQGSFGYGFEWSKADIDAGIVTHDPTVQVGHGTGSAGLAAGDGSTVGKYKGAAPKADIIHVNIAYNEFFLSNFVDASAYIYQKASELGKPCVINSSVGTYRGAHDDRGLEVQAIDNLLSAENGRAMTQSAGNGAVPFFNSCNYWHLSYPVTEDTVFTFFRHSNILNEVHFDMFADTADFNNVWWSFGPRSRTTFEKWGHSKWHNVIEDANMHIFSQGTIRDTVFVDNQIYGIIRVDIERNQGVYDMLFRVTGTIPQDYWEFHTTGSGTFDVWSSFQYMGTSKISNCAMPTVMDVPEMANYMAPDTVKTLVSSWACSEKVITVANYSNLDSYEYYGGGTFTNSVPRHHLVYDSSTGPTRTGVQKPEIGASGNFTWAPAVLSILTDLQVNAPVKVAPEGWHAAFSGTSASSPIVAGTIACYFELFPDASYQEVKDALIASAKVDSFVLLKGPVPNYGFGYGKLDGFKFINDAIVYGCTDASANNYNPDATIDDGSCEIVSVELPEGLLNRFEVVPNPFSGEALVSIELNGVYDSELVVSDILGRALFSQSVVGNGGKFVLEGDKLPKGLFFVTLIVEGEGLVSRKVVRY